MSKPIIAGTGICSGEGGMLPEEQAEISGGIPVGFKLSANHIERDIQFALDASAMQSIGCVAARICNTNNCPTGIATQKPELRARLDVGRSSQQLQNYLLASVELMSVMARACGHDNLNQFNSDDLSTWKHEMSMLSGIRYAGVKQTP